jgi:hypothetical protein
MVPTPTRQNIRNGGKKKDDQGENIKDSSSANDNSSKELAFRDYVEVYDGMDNTSRPRSIPCIALYPCANKYRIVGIYKPSYLEKVRRSQWKLMKTNQLIVETMNAFDLDDHDDFINLDGDYSNNGGTGNPENIGEPDGDNETSI